jgi:choice-of-anchor B domain-containing protein
MKILLTLLLVNLPLIFNAQAIEGNLLAQWSDSSLPGSSAYDNTYNEVWGLVVNNREIAVIGSTMGTHFIDVTNPSAILEIEFVAGAATGPQIVHRDYHDYNGYLYAVADEGSNSTLQIIDITTLPDSVSVVYNSNSLIRQSHNIFIDSSAARLYALATSGVGGYGSLKIFSLEDPINPVLIKTFGSNLLGKSISHVHDAFVENNIAYLNCGPNGFALVDFSDIANPVLISSLDNSDYPQAGYNHSGWPSKDGNFYYMADEDWDKDIKVIDMSNLPDLNVVGFIDAGNDNKYSIPHNQLVHDDLLYVSYYFDGLQVYDISNPASPERVMYYPTSQQVLIPNYKGSWGVYPYLPSGNILVSDMQEGLFVVEKFNKTSSTTVLDRSNMYEVYPTNISSEFNITGDLKLIKNVLLIDIKGNTLYQWNTAEDKYYIDKELNAGNYFIKIQTSTGDIIKRVVVSK